MVIADSRDSLDGACVVDKSQHYGSNGSSEQHGAEQMMQVQPVGAFVHKQSHTEPVSWLADEPHVVEVPDLPTVNVCVSSAVTTIFGCKLDAVVHKSDADNCWRVSPGWILTVVLVTVGATRALLPSPFRNKKFDATVDWQWSCLRWVYEVV